MWTKKSVLTNFEKHVPSVTEEYGAYIQTHTKHIPSNIKELFPTSNTSRSDRKEAVS
jgi:hypothetical protein